MIFSIVVIVLVVGIAYFHWVQGLFSGVISMVLAILAGSLAMGYHESIATGLMGGKVADSANAMMMCVIFCLVYGIGRVVFDSMIPGNVRLPLYFDAVGGGVCGLIAGIFAVGTFAVAAQSMAFGPSVLLSSRYPLADDKSVTVDGERRQEMAIVTGALEDDFPDESKELGLMLPVDSMVVNYAAFQSESGALAGSTSLRDRHPNYLRELFFQRVGIELAAKHSALNIAGRTDVTVDAVYAPSALPQMDGEDPLIRTRKVPAQLKADPAKALLVFRVSITKGAVDGDGFFRFSPGQVRLVAGGKNYYAIGTIFEPGRANLLMSNRIDDYLVAALDGSAGKATIDIAFLVDRADVLANAAKEAAKFKPDAFLEVKRFARVALAEKNIAPTMPPASEATGMVWKKAMAAAVTARLAQTGDVNAKPAAK